MAYVRALGLDDVSDESAHVAANYANSAVEKLRDITHQKTTNFGTDRAESGRNSRARPEKSSSDRCTCYVRSDSELSDEWTTKRGLKHHFRCAMYERTVTPMNYTRSY